MPGLLCWCRSARNSAPLVDVAAFALVVSRFRSFGTVAAKPDQATEGSVVLKIKHRRFAAGCLRQQDGAGLQQEKLKKILFAKRSCSGKAGSSEALLINPLLSFPIRAYPSNPWFIKSLTTDGHGLTRMRY